LSRTARGSLDPGRFLPDKQGILDAIAVRGVEEFRESLERHLEETGPVDPREFMDLTRETGCRTRGAGEELREQPRDSVIVGPGPKDPHCGRDRRPSDRIRLLPTDEARARVIAEMKQLLAAYLFASCPLSREVIIDLTAAV
jgi:hypothetical protein